MDTPENIKDELLENELIKLRTLPGNYAPIMDALHAFNIVHCEEREGWLYIFTPESEMLIHYILHLLKDLDETIDKLIVTEPDLGEVFEKLADRDVPRIMKAHVDTLKQFVFDLIGKNYSAEKIKTIMVSHDWPKEVADAVVSKELRIINQRR